MDTSAALVVLPRPAVDNTLELASYELVEHLVAASRVPLVAIPHASRAPSDEFFALHTRGDRRFTGDREGARCHTGLAHMTEARVVIAGWYGRATPPRE
jgi:hypothetical protein